MISSLFENLKSSGHHFSENENLEKYRFSLLNINLVVAAFFSGLSYIFSVTGFSTFDPTYEIILLFCTVMYALCIYPLRVSKQLYWLIANLTIVISLVLFYSALVTSFLEDEFRLIWFFLVVFASFIYMGRKYGVYLALTVMLSIGIINQFHDLGFSKQAQITFYISFIIFCSFAYNFLNKIESDALEFRKLNLALEGKVDREVQQREQQEQMLLQQYRMANMGGMLDAIAHQWRQPLMNINAILMNIDNALEDLQPKKKIYLDDKMDDLSSLTQHMSQTIEDFRSLLKVPKDQSEFSVEAAVNEVLQLMKASLNDVVIDSDTQEDTLVTGHKSELVQVIIIIISNAIEVLEKRQVEEKRISVKAHLLEGSGVISIQDNAGGIKDENMNIIFDPYFTTKQQSGGTGLGLYIAKIITEQRMEGQLTASNTEHGAKFIISFPVDHT